MATSAPCSGLNATVLSRLAMSSKFAMVRKGSPAANAHGAVSRGSCSENHRDSATGLPSMRPQPPTPTPSSDACASARKETVGLCTGATAGTQ
eukprot:11461580-Alexandrium_andersonii.AAC.1